MTPQAKGFQWSAAVHGMVMAVVVAVQFFAVPPNRVAVIDFTFSGSGEPSVVEQPSSPLTPPMKQAPKRARSIPPQEAVAQPVLPPQSAEPPPPREAPVTPEEPPAPLPRTVEGLGGPTAEGTPSAIFPPPTAGAPGTTIPKEARHASPAADGPSRGATESLNVARAAPTLETSRATYLKEHFVYIRDRITGSISYPPMARKMGWCGRVKISFVVCEDGGVTDVRIVESSGFTMLDRNAVDTVKNVAPFPNPPVKAEIRMAITYRLN